MIERRRGDDDRLIRVERALFDEDGVSNLKVMKEEQRRMHETNDDRLADLERALFDEAGESRLQKLEVSVRSIDETLGKSQFLGKVVLGVFTVVGPAVSAFISWLLMHK